MSDLLTNRPSLDRTIGASRLRMWVRPELAISRIEGHFSAEIATEFMAHAEPIIRKSRAFVGLHDWTEAPTFDVVVPPRVGAWTVSLLSRISRIVIATQHPLVSMAVRTTNLSIKRIEHLGSRAAFEEAVRAATSG